MGIRKTFRPHFVKDGVRQNILGLISTAIVVPAVFLFVYAYLNYIERAPMPSSFASTFFWLGAGLEMLMVLPILYGILSILRSKVIVTDNELTVINGFRKTIVPIKQVKEITYKHFSKGIDFVFFPPPRLSVGGLSKTWYKSGGIVYLKDSKRHELELPRGWVYLQDLAKELKNVSGHGLTIDRKNFKLELGWQKTPFISRVCKALFVIILVALYFTPPTIIWVWVSDTWHLFGWGIPWDEQSDYQRTFGGLFGAFVYIVYILVSLMLLKVADAVRKVSSGGKMTKERRNKSQD